MPLKVPNYRAVSEMFSKKPNEPSPLSQVSGERGVAGIGENSLPKPSGASNPTFQRPPRPRDYVVPLHTQTPRTVFHRWWKPSTQSSTIPQSAPLSDPRLGHLIGDSVTRRQAIITALGEQKANNFIDKSTAYRQANPKLFKGVYGGGNIDRPIKVLKNDEAMAEDGLYWPVDYNHSTKKLSPGRIEVRGDNPFSTLMHELFHLDTSGSRPQDVEGIFKGLQKGRRVRPFVQHLYNTYRPVGSRTGKDAKVITDRSYDPDGGSNRSEMGSQLGTLRVHLEQLGIDTSNKEELRKALSTMGDDPRIMHNFEAQRIHRALNDPTLSPEQRERGLDALVELMPGIAKADTTQYPYRKVAAEPSTLSQEARDRIEWIRKNPLPQPSGPPDMSDQDLYPPPAFAVPTPTQPPPQSFAPQLRKPPMQRSTMPMSAPLSDPRLDHLTGDSVTRRDAISTALGEPRATNFIDKSTAYRKANPKIFKGVYDGGNIDRPMKVIRNDGFYAPHGLYTPATYVPKTNEVVPGDIKVRGDNPFGTLMHEFFHLDTSGSRPQDVEGAFSDIQKGKVVKPIGQLLYNRFRPVGSRTGKDAKTITDRAYYPDGGGDRSEMGSQLGALRVHLEQLGIDTSNKEELRKVLSTMGDDPRIMHNFEAQRIHRALNDPTLSPQQRERGLDALVELMPGIAKADTTQYPYRKVASKPSSPLRGLTIMSTISALLKGR